MSQFENQVSTDRRIMGIPVIGNPSALTPNLQFDAALNAFKWVSSSTGGMSAMEKLAVEMIAGNGSIIKTDRTGSTGVLGSIVPAIGKTFILYGASVSVRGIASANAVQFDLRNDGTIRESLKGNVITGIERFNEKFLTTGDALIGDGVKAYDINVSATDANYQLSTTIEGYVQDT